MVPKVLPEIKTLKAKLERGALARLGRPLHHHLRLPRGLLLLRHRADRQTQLLPPRAIHAYNLGVVDGAGSCFFVFFFIEFFCQGSWLDPKSLPSRIIFFISFLCGITIYTAYSAKLISFLSIPNIVQPFSSLQVVP